MTAIFRAALVAAFTDASPDSRGRTERGPVFRRPLGRKRSILIAAAAPRSLCASR